MSRFGNIYNNEQTNAINEILNTRLHYSCGDVCTEKVELGVSPRGFGDGNTDRDFEQAMQYIEKIYVDKTKVNITIESWGINTISCIREIRNMFGLGLFYCKQIVEREPYVLFEQVEYKTALLIKDHFENIGAKVILSED